MENNPISILGYNSDCEVNVEKKPNFKQPKIDKSKKELLILNGAKCYICDFRLTKLTFTWDHIIAKSKGGKKKKECCIFCNNQKGDMGIYEFIDYLKTLKSTPLIENKIKNLESYAENARKL